MALVPPAPAICEIQIMNFADRFAHLRSDRALLIGVAKLIFLVARYRVVKIKKCEYFRCSDYLMMGLKH